MKLINDLTELDEEATQGKWREHEDVACSIVSSVEPNMSLLVKDLDGMFVFGNQWDGFLTTKMRNILPDLIGLLKTVESITNHSTDSNDGLVSIHKSDYIELLNAVRNMGNK